MEQSMVTGIKTTLMFRPSYLLIFLLLSIAANSQKEKKPFYIRVGMSASHYVIREAYKPPAILRTFDMGDTKAFTGEGPEFGIGKHLSERSFIDIGFSTFTYTGQNWEAGGRNGTLSYSYRMMGWVTPVTFNYLLRDSTRKLRINTGLGLQLNRVLFQQTETMNAYSVTRIIRDVDLAEVSFIARPGIQYRVLKRLYVSYLVNISISTSGRYADHLCLSARYAFSGR